MSAVGETGQPPTAAARGASWPIRALHVVLWSLLVLAGLVLVGASALSWRLAQGPLDVTSLLRSAERRMLPADAPTRLTFDDATIAWNGFDRGSDHGLQLRLHGVQALGPDGAPEARVAEADVSLSLLRLLEGRVVPRSIALTGLRLRAIRLADGTVRLDATDAAGAGAAEPNLPDILAQLRQPAGNDQTRSASGLDALAQLQHVRLSDAQFVLDDQPSGQTWRAGVADLDLQRQGQGGVKGAASGEIGLGAATAALRLKADLAPGGGTHVEATLAPLASAALAQSPGLESIGALDATLHGSATADLSPALLPRAAELHVASGGGAFTLAGGTLKFDRLALDATGRWQGGWRPAQVTLTRAQAVLPSPRGEWSTTIEITGDATRGDGKIAAAAHLTLDHVAFADLGTLWPEAWGGNVRPWLVENVSGGAARDGAFSIKAAAPDSDLAAIALTDASGTLQADELVIHWLRPVPPLEHGRAVMTVLGPDVIEIAVSSAAQGAIALKDGKLRFTGLSGKDQDMILTTAVAGPVASVLQLLQHKRLHLLDKHPVAITSASGAMAGKLSIEMPMKKQLTFDQVAIVATGHMSALRLGGIVAGRDLERGEIEFHVDQDGLQASGPATIAGLNGAAEVDMDFRQGPPSQVVQHAAMKGRATVAQLRAADADPANVVRSGQASVDARYTSLRDGSGKVELHAGLAEAGLSLLGWRKAPGPEASVAATLLLDHDKLAGISGIDVRGPALVVVARAEMVGGKPRILRFERIQLGQTHASGETRFPEAPGQPIRVRLTGSQIDLSDQLTGSSGGNGGSGGKQTEGLPWIADARFERVLLGKGRALDAVTAHADNDGHKFRALDVSSTGPERIRIVIAPQGAGRKLQVRAANAGALLHALDVTDTIGGGALAIDAVFDDARGGPADPPLSGTLDLTEFGVHDAVAVGKLLQAITIYGIADAVQGKGVHFSRLVAPFRYDRRQLRLGETQAFSSSLGLTAQGWIDFPRNILDIRGTIVPAYALNSALGRIPLVGRLFSPERGGGLVAVNYAVTGNASNPNINVNPLSALTPGFLRGLFNLFN